MLLIKVHGICKPNSTTEVCPVIDVINQLIVELHLDQHVSSFDTLHQDPTTVQSFKHNT